MAWACGKLEWKFLLKNILMKNPGKPPPEKPQIGLNSQHLLYRLLHGHVEN
jgi:hypothetical protein